MDPIYVAEWTAFVFAFFLLMKNNDARIRLMLLALSIEILTETLAGYYSTVFANNHIFYIVSAPLVNWIYAIVISRGLTRPENRRTALKLILGFWVFVIVNVLFIQGSERYNSYSSIAATAMLCSLTVLYYNELVKAERIIRLRAEPIFWLCAAFMLLGIPRVVFWSVFEYMVFSENYTYVKDFGATFQAVNIALCMIFYSMLCFAFVCRLAFRKSALTNQAPDPVQPLPLPHVHAQKKPGPAFS